MVMPVAMSTTTTTRTRDQVLARWQDIARAAAGELPIAPDCAQHLFEFFEEGAKELDRSGKLSDADAIREADNDAWRFVRQMVVEAEQQGLQRLHEPTFFGAKSILCPLWPFCR